MRNTPAGREGSRKHNSMLRLATLRHAVVEHLRSPPLGFEEITKRHFSICKRRLVAQARRWMLEEKGTSLYPRFQRVYSEMLQLLTEFDNDESLSPLPDDVSFLRDKDPDFPQVEIESSPSNEPAALNDSSLSEASSPQTSKPAVSSTSADATKAEYNPWAGPSTSHADNRNAGSTGDDTEEEDMYS